MAAFGGAQPDKGHFLNGIWHCDCTPRIPAVHLETKKTGPNHGRWFRTCAKPREGKCKFFLWDSDAQARENSAAPPTPNRKRKRSASGNFDDEYPLTQGADDDLNETMSTIETPSKVAPPNSFITPAAKRRNLPWGVGQSSATATHGLQTPQTERRVAGDPFPSSNPTPTSSALTASQATEDDTHRFATPSTSLNRTPAINRPSNAASENLVSDVLGLLQRSSVRLNDHTEKELNALLKRHAKTSEGYKRGRDVMRTTVKAKDAKITELTYRIGTLEAELEAEKATVKHLEWEAQSDTSGFD